MKNLLRLIALFVTPMLAVATATESFVFFGTYTGPKSKGIYRAKFDSATGRLAAAELAAECSSPSFLAAHPSGRFLYAIDERADATKDADRGVAAYAVDARTGTLTLLNEQGIGSSGPCHLEVDATGRCLLVANYAGGTVVSLPIATDGRLGPARSHLRHAGSSVNAARQKEPHAHAITIAPGNRFAYAPDLGIDKVMIYQVDPAAATLEAAAHPFAQLPLGSGPRHIAFRPDGKFAYVINELLCTMAVFAVEAKSGALIAAQSISTLPTGATVQRGQSTAEVHAHPSGRFLYGSNRGHNTIVVYAIEAATGRLTLVEHQSTQGQTPRHFAIDPSGGWLLAENQGSDTVVVFRIDPKTGRLTPTGQSLAVPVPVCAVFVAAAK
ncbi:MAG: lactonase family protein [Opitutaceae bacterium]|nr:lactonase family protein [Opitutaceae bacterium]